MRRTLRPTDSDSADRVALVMGCLLWSYRELALRQRVDHETRANADLARAFVNAEWTTYLDHTARSAGRPRKALLADPGFAQLDREVRQHVRGLQVAKVKIHDLRGITVYATDPKQVDEDKSADEAFRAAREGRASGQVTFRERFDAFEGVLNQRNLVASYIPLRAPGGRGRHAFYRGDAAAEPAWGSGLPALVHAALAGSAGHPAVEAGFERQPPCVSRSRRGPA